MGYEQTNPGLARDNKIPGSGAGKTAPKRPVHVGKAAGGLRSQQLLCLPQLFQQLLLGPEKPQFPAKPPKRQKIPTWKQGKTLSSHQTGKARRDSDGRGNGDTWARKHLKIRVHEQVGSKKTIPENHTQIIPRGIHREVSLGSAPHFLRQNSGMVCAGRDTKFVVFPAGFGF